MKTPIFLRVFAGVVSVAVVGCVEAWRQHVTVSGVAFDRVRGESGGRLIGEIPADTVIAGRPCQRGWLQLHPNGVPARFTAARDVTVGALVIPSGTWVGQGSDGTIQVCAFPGDVEVQGHWCRGTGGPKGVQASFHASGALRQFYPPRVTRIDGVSCRPGLANGVVELHENGRLKACLLDEDFECAGYFHPAGSRIEFLADGRVRGDP